PLAFRAVGTRRASLTLVLQLVPGGHGGELEQGAAAAGIAVAEVGAVVVPGDLEQTFLDAVVEPGAAEHELAQPVDKRLAPDERHTLPVPDEVPAERAARLDDHTVGSKLDEVGGLVAVELVALDQAEPHGGRGHALLEVVLVEAEAITEELDDEVVA